MSPLLAAVISRQRAQSELQKTILPEITLPPTPSPFKCWNGLV